MVNPTAYGGTNVSTFIPRLAHPLRLCSIAALAKWPRAERRVGPTLGGTRSSAAATAGWGTGDPTSDRGLRDKTDARERRWSEGACANSRLNAPKRCAARRTSSTSEGGEGEGEGWAIGGGLAGEWLARAACEVGDGPAG